MDSRIWKCWFVFYKPIAQGDLDILLLPQLSDQTCENSCEPNEEQGINRSTDRNCTKLSSPLV